MGSTGSVSGTKIRESSDSIISELKRIGNEIRSFDNDLIKKFDYYEMLMNSYDGSEIFSYMDNDNLVRVFANISGNGNYTSLKNSFYESFYEVYNGINEIEGILENKALNAANTFDKEIERIEKYLEDKNNRFKILPLGSEMKWLDARNEFIKNNVGPFVNFNVVTGFLFYETNRIVAEHMNDFNVNTFDDYMIKHGGYENYVKSLGGVFTKYANKDRVKISTKKEFQEIADYIWGMMTIYGFDYSNGDPNHSGFYGGLDKHSPDAFYTDDNEPDYSISNQSKEYLTNSADFVFAGGGAGMTTDCTNGITWTFKKAGLIDQNAPSIEDEFYGDSHRYYRNRGAVFLENKHDIEVGDVIGFYKDDSYSHVSLVVSVTKDGYTCYDSGHYFTNNMIHYWSFSKDQLPTDILTKYDDYKIMRLPLGLE